MDKIAQAIAQGFNAYKTLKEFYKEPEKANIQRGYQTKCNADAWNRGFQKAMSADKDRIWNDSDRFLFLKRIGE